MRDLESPWGGWSSMSCPPLAVSAHEGHGVRTRDTGADPSPAQLERVGGFSHRLAGGSRQPVLKLQHPWGWRLPGTPRHLPKGSGPREVTTQEAGDQHPARVYAHILPAAPAQHLQCCFYCHPFL